MSTEDAFNFIRISPLLATAGQPSEDQFRDAQTAGYAVVVDLAPDGLETSLPGEAELLRGLGMEY